MPYTHSHRQRGLTMVLMQVIALALAITQFAPMAVAGEGRSEHRRREKPDGKLEAPVEEVVRDEAARHKHTDRLQTIEEHRGAVEHREGDRDRDRHRDRDRDREHEVIGPPDREEVGPLHSHPDQDGDRLRDRDRDRLRDRDRDRDRDRHRDREHEVIGPPDREEVGSLRSHSDSVLETLDRLPEPPEHPGDEEGERQGFLKHLEAYGKQVVHHLESSVAHYKKALEKIEDPAKRAELKEKFLTRLDEVETRVNETIDQLVERVQGSDLGDEAKAKALGLLEEFRARVAELLDQIRGHIE